MALKKYEKKSKKELVEDRKEKLDEVMEKLEKGVAGLVNSEAYKEYLKCMSKFHNYSLNNSLLIAFQKPDSTYVAGYTTWKQQFDRQVKKGEKGIKILAPAPYKKKDMVDVLDKEGRPVLDKDGNQKKEEVVIEVPAFKVVTVFDISSTEGKELPSVGVSELIGSVEGFKLLSDAIDSISPVPIVMANIETGAKGYFSPKEQKICIQEGMSELQTLKTKIHELAHALLHDKDNKRIEGITDTADKSRFRKEIEAESIAYVVCQAINGGNEGSVIDTSEYSFSYIAGWGGGADDLKELKESLETIRVTADKIINDIEKQVKERQKEMDRKVPFREQLESARAEMQAEGKMELTKNKAKGKATTL